MAPRAGVGLRRDDVILISFPFADLSGQKPRPALIVGRPLREDVVLALITSRVEAVTPAAEYLLRPTDPEFPMTGLRLASRIRVGRLATVHRALIRRRLGRIGPDTRRAVERALRVVLDL